MIIIDLMILGHWQPVRSAVLATAGLLVCLAGCDTILHRVVARSLTGHVDQCVLAGGVMQTTTSISAWDRPTAGSSQWSARITQPQCTSCY